MMLSCSAYQVCVLASSSDPTAPFNDSPVCHLVVSMESTDKTETLRL